VPTVRRTSSSSDNLKVALGCWIFFPQFPEKILLDSGWIFFLRNRGEDVYGGGIVVAWRWWDAAGHACEGRTQVSALRVAFRSGPAQSIVTISVTVRSRAVEP